ncbi:MAG: phospholipase D-like domain-containing protein [Candidatus Helarchaeota archaeon]
MTFADSEIYYNHFKNTSIKLNKVVDHLKKRRINRARDCLKILINEQNELLNKSDRFSDRELRTLITINKFLEEFAEILDRKNNSIHFSPEKNNNLFELVEDNKLGLRILEYLNLASEEVRIESPWIWGIPELMNIIERLNDKRCRIKILTRRPKLNKKDEEHLSFLDGLIENRVHISVDDLDHRKIVIIDDKIAYLGNANLTNRSFNVTSNAGFLIRDKNWINELINKFDKKFKSAMRDYIIPLYQIKLGKIADLKDEAQNINLKLKIHNIPTESKKWKNYEIWTYNVTDGEDFIELISWNEKLNVELGKYYLIKNVNTKVYYGKRQITSYGKILPV